MAHSGDMDLWFRTRALTDVVVRSGRMTTHHWRRRHMEPVVSYTAREAEFLPASLEIVERPASPAGRLTGRLLVLLLALAIAWASLARVDIVVRANGKVIPNSRTKTIAAVEVASVRAIHVHEGQHVNAGDVLIELDARSIEAEQRKAEGEAVAARLEVERSRALIAAIDSNRRPRLPRLDGVPDDLYRQTEAHLFGQYFDYLAKRTELEGQITRYSRALPLAQERARNYQELSTTHDVAANTSSEKMQAAIDLEGQLSQARAQLGSLTAETRRRAFDSLTDAAKIVASSTQDAARAQSHTRLLVLHAPVDGTVHQLTVFTVGGVVPAAQPLMLIVPEADHVEVEAWIENRDIGFVHEDQPAEVKIDAFDYTRHGLVHGRVSLVSKDAVEDEKRGPIYKTLLTLGHPFLLVDGQVRELTPGLAVNAEIKTGRRRIIDYLLSPLMRHGHESLHER
jgi:hemolysin D